MMSILYLFWMYVILFAIIGAMRGWAKELLVSFSAITALTINLLMDKYVPLVRDLPDNSSSVFWTRALILLALVYFGYQTVNLAPRLGSKAARERLQDALFGAVVGGLNGYFIAGSILFYNHVAEYPYRNVISPAADPTIIATIDRMMQYMPPRLLGEPGIYFAIVIILVFIIVVYI